MKRLSVIALAVAAVMLFAIPAMALDVEFSGHYRARGIYVSDPDFTNEVGGADRGDSDAKLDQRFRLQTVFKVSDTLKVTTRFDAVDNDEWDSPNASETFNFDRAYLTASFEMFDLNVGRMGGGTYGDAFMDGAYDADRIKPVVKGLDPLQLVLLYQKHNETDWDAGTAAQSADSDWDVYGGILGYKAEGLYAGVLVLLYDNQTAPTYSQTYTRYNPYVNFATGPFTIKGELDWRTGDYADYDDATTDRDLDRMAYMIDAAFNFGQGNVGIGYAHADGQDTNDNDYTKTGGAGADWEPLLILTGYSTVPAADGNLNGNNAAQTSPTGTGTWGDLGFDMFYLYGDYVLTEDVTLNAIIATVSADETNSVGTNVDDDIGLEFNVGAKWQIMDGLAYNITLGWLSAGDLFKGASGTAYEEEDCYAVMHTLKVTF